MFNLYVLKETFFNGYNMELIYFLYFSSIFSGILVIISKNPIISVLFLIGLFLSISGYLIILGMNFIGISYILVYVGAVSILFLFILMLINVRISELLSYTNNSIPLAIIIGIVFMYSIYEIYPNYKFYINFNLLNDEIMYATSITWDGNLSENSHISSIGNIIYTNYFILLIITSLILLLAMIGTICLVISN
jgi:NADH-ubiquinone oxidoreductase chain 6